MSDVSRGTVENNLGNHIKLGEFLMTSHCIPTVRNLAEKSRLLLLMTGSTEVPFFCFLNSYFIRLLTDQK